MKNHTTTICVALLLFLVFSNTAFTKDNLNKLTPEIIFHKFPVCSFPSSLGQWCKALPKNEREVFSFSKLPGSVVYKTILRTVEIIRFSEKKLFVKEKDWFHTFDIEEKGENEFEVLYTDEGISGTYYTKELYKIIFDAEFKKWKIVAKKLVFSQGEELDSKFLNTGDILFLD